MTYDCNFFLKIIFSDKKRKINLVSFDDSGLELVNGNIKCW
jgi:hypothetical protein